MYSSNIEPNSVKSFKTSRDKVALPSWKRDSALCKEVGLKLPLPGALRWSARSKAAVVSAVRSGILTLEAARQHYSLSTAEYLSWEGALDALGLHGLGLAGRQVRRRGLTYCEK